MKKRTKIVVGFVAVLLLITGLYTLEACIGSEAAANEPMAKTALSCSEVKVIHEWRDAGVDLTILRPGAKPADPNSKEPHSWYNNADYYIKDQIKYRIQFCARCGMLRLILKEPIR